MNNTPCNSLINGIAADYIDIDDRSIHYGDGLFETILCSEGKLYYWQQHFQRLQASAQQLKISCPEEHVLLKDIANLLASNKPLSNAESHYVIKIILSRGAGERGYKYSKETTVNRFVLLSELAAGHSSILSNSLLSGELSICSQQVSINENLAGLKHLNRLDNVMARNEWHDNNGTIIDGVMMNADRHVIEGTMSNIFAVKDKQLFTPSLDRSGVKGVMRDVVMDLAVENNLQLSVTDLDIDDFSAMDELFITNSLIGMKRVTKLGDTIYQQHTVTDILFDELLSKKEGHAQAV
jgi:4-amino-4-deoxychorismate lyase